MVALAVVVGFFVGCGDDDDEESASTGTTTTEAEETPAPTGKSQGSVDVSLTEYKVTLKGTGISKPGVYTLNVSNDFALRSWILGFGGLARVIAPAALAAEIQSEAARMAALYR